MNAHPDGPTARIVKALAEKPCSTDDLMAITGLPRQQVSNKIHLLKAQRRVASDGKRGFQQPQMFRLVTK